MSPPAPSKRESFLRSYPRGRFYDEILGPQAARWASAPLAARLAAMTPRARSEAQTETESAVRAMDITFALYDEGKGAGVDRAWPLDAVPRVIDAPAWREVERGLAQRLRALNQFIHDIHHDGKILRATKSSPPNSSSNPPITARNAAAQNPATTHGRTSAAPTSSATRTEQ